MSEHEPELVGGRSVPRIGESLLNKRGLGSLLWSKHERESQADFEYIPTHSGVSTLKAGMVLLLVSRLFLAEKDDGAKVAKYEIG